MPPRPRPGAWPPGAPVPIADRQHRPRRIALALTRASGLAFVVGATALLMIVAPLGADRDAAAAVSRELPALLEPDERVLAQATVSQRRATDLWRRTHGVLAVTTQRLVLVAATPRPILRPIEPGPRELVLHSWPADAAVAFDGESDDRTGTLRVGTAARSRIFRIENASDARALVGAASAPRPSGDARPNEPPPY